LKGFYMRISGKISVTGNAKTRSQYIKWGEFSTSKKDNRLDLSQNIIRTNTGALGVTIMICY
jgi:ribosomal protein S3